MANNTNTENLRAYLHAYNTFENARVSRSEAEQAMENAAINAVGHPNIVVHDYNEVRAVHYLINNHNFSGSITIASDISKDEEKKVRKRLSKIRRPIRIYD